MVYYFCLNKCKLEIEFIKSQKCYQDFVQLISKYNECTINYILNTTIQKLSQELLNKLNKTHFKCIEKLRN